MEGDGDNEDNDVDQQESLPRLTTYKEASYNCFGRCVLLLHKEHGHETLCISSNIDKIVKSMHLQDKRHCVTTLFSD